MLCNTWPWMRRRPEYVRRSVRSCLEWMGYGEKVVLEESVSVGQPEVVQVYARRLHPETPVATTSSMPISELTRQQEEAQRKAIERYLEDGSTVQVRVSKRRRSRRSGAGAERAKVVEAPPSPIPEEAAPGGAFSSYPRDGSRA